MNRPIMEVLRAKSRRHFTGMEKVAILREHLIEKVAVSDLCEKHGLHPTLFCQWQKKLFEDGAVVLERSRATLPGRPQGSDARRLEALEWKLVEKNEVLAEFLGEYVAPKKSRLPVSDPFRDNGYLLDSTIPHP